MLEATGPRVTQVRDSVLTRVNTGQHLAPVCPVEPASKPDEDTVGPNGIPFCKQYHRRSIGRLARFHQT